MSTPTRPQIDFRTLELWAGLSVTLLLVVFEFRFYNFRGGLWRDEVASVNLASQTPLTEVWRQNHNDSFPILWITILYGWIHYAFGATDPSLDLFGLLFGLSAVGIYWWSARQAGVNVPWVLLVILGMNPSTIVFGSEVRAYGLGVITELAMLTALLLYVMQPTWWHALGALIAALLCVQSVYTNSVMLAAAAIAWGIVCIWQRQWQVLGVLVGICMLAALSVVPYYFTFARHSAWMDIVQAGFHVSFFLRKFNYTLSTGGPVTLYVWLLLFLGAGAGCIWQIRNARSNRSPQDVSLTAWCLIAFFLGPIFHFAFMKFLKVETAHWYYLPLLAFTAYSMELAYDNTLAASSRGKKARFVLAVIVVLATLPNNWVSMKGMMTNVDIHARDLKHLARPGDLIVVWPSYITPVFKRYYEEERPPGQVAWIGLPNFDDKSFYYHALFKERMFREKPIEEELQQVQHALQSGHRVWIIGEDRPLRNPKGQPMALPNAPSAQYPFLWNQVTYSSYFFTCLVRDLLLHCRSPDGKPQFGYFHVEHNSGDDVPIQPIERQRLFCAEGWQD